MLSGATVALANFLPTEISAMRPPFTPKNEAMSLCWSSLASMPLTIDASADESRIPGLGALMMTRTDVFAPLGSKEILRSRAK